MTSAKPDSTATYLWDIEENVVIIRAQGGQVDVPNFNRFLDDVRRSPVNYFFAIASGVALLSAVQRRDSAEVLKQKGIKTFVVTDNALTRGIVTAVSWLGAEISSFSWKDFDKALKLMNASAKVEKRIRVLAKEFNPVEFGS